MKCQSQISGENRENIINFLPAEYYVHRNSLRSIYITYFIKYLPCISIKSSAAFYIGKIFSLHPQYKVTKVDARLSVSVDPSWFCLRFSCLLATDHH